MLAMTLQVVWRLFNRQTKIKVGSKLRMALVKDEKVFCHPRIASKMSYHWLLEFRRRRTKSIWGHFPGNLLLDIGLTLAEEEKEANSTNSQGKKKHDAADNANNESCREGTGNCPRLSVLVTPFAGKNCINIVLHVSENDLLGCVITVGITDDLRCAGEIVEIMETLIAGGFLFG